VTESDERTTKPERRETEDKAEGECLAATVGHISECKPLVLVQVNCRSICNKIVEFWHVIDTYNPDVICTGSWLSEEINNVEIFTDDYKNVIGVRYYRVGAVFNCIKNYIDCRVKYTDEFLFR